MLSRQTEQKIFEALGQASMCWEPKPEGEFDSLQCQEIGNKLIDYIAQQG